MVVFEIEYSLAQLESVVQTLFEKLQPNDNVMLNGGLGAGKTTLIQGMLKNLGYDGYVLSPSYSIMHHYELKLAHNFELVKKKHISFLQTIRKHFKDNFKDISHKEDLKQIAVPYNVYHFDMYRLEDEKEFYRLSMDKIFASFSLVLVEWAEKISACRELATKEIIIEVCSTNSRKLYLKQLT